MFENSGMPPEEFIKEILLMYHQHKVTVADLSARYGVLKATIVHIIEMYEFNVNDSQLRLAGPKKVDEFSDKKRNDQSKLTREDLDDLRIDMDQFEKGKSIDNEEEGK